MILTVRFSSLALSVSPLLVLFSLSPFPSRPSLIPVSHALPPGDCLLALIVAPGTAAPVLSEEFVWPAGGRTGDRELQGPCIRGEGDSQRGKHTASGEEGFRGPVRSRDEAKTAHGGAVCRAPPAGPGQDLPPGWRRRICSQQTRPQSISQGQGANQLFL